MILVGYHSISGCKLYDPINNAKVISRYVIVNELNEWNWDKTQRRDIIRVIFYELKATEEAQVKENVRMLTRSKFIATWLQDCELFPNNEVTDSADLVHFVVIVESEHVKTKEDRSDLTKEFEMTNLGHIENFLGTEFLKTDKGQFKH